MSGPTAALAEADTTRRARLFLAALFYVLSALLLGRRPEAA